MKKAVLILTIIGFSSSSFSQNNLNVSEATKEKKTEFGFNFGGFQTFIHSNEELPSNYKIENSAGFRLGLVMKYKFTKSFSFSPKAELGFSNSSISNQFEPNQEFTNQLYNTHLEFMTHFGWTRTDWNWNPYVAIGPSFRVPITKKDEIPIINSYDFGIDMSIGFNKSFTQLNIQPELRFSSGITNIINENGLPKVRYNSISLVLNFLGS